MNEFRGSAVPAGATRDRAGHTICVADENHNCARTFAYAKPIKWPEGQT